MEPTSARALLSKYGLAPSKERGQNFLVDANVAAKVVEAVAPGEDEVVVEVGPGFGVITLGVAARAAHVVAVEQDAGLVRAFTEEHPDVENVTLVHGDALNIDLGSIAQEYGVDAVVLAGNLPYNLTSPILKLLVDNRDRLKRGVFMLQREVADRLLAAPGTPDYSALTAVMRFHADVRSHFSVSRTCFHPRPAVDSRVVELALKAPSPGAPDPALYSEVVHAAFGKRRKMLRQALLDVVRDMGSTIESLAQLADIDMERRGETLSVGEFERLAVALGRARREPGSDARSR